MLHFGVHHRSPEEVVRGGHLSEKETPSSYRYNLPADRVALKDYHGALVEVIRDVRVPVYLDANILNWMLRVGSRARREFTDWCEAEPGRVRVPVWAAHEFYRLLREKKPLQDANSALRNNANSLQYLLSELTFQMDQHRCQDDPTAFLGRAQDDLKIIWDKVCQMTKGDDWYRSAVDAVVDFVNRNVLEDDIFDIFDECIPLAERRFSVRVPPGYNDRNKGENKAGDLVFWKEVLKDAAASKADHIVILTDDNKSDWSFAPSEIRSYADVRVGNNPLEGVSARVPHPMLVLEARLANVGNVTILNPEIMAGVLDLVDPASAKALVQATHPPELRFDTPLAGINRDKIDPPIRRRKEKGRGDGDRREKDGAAYVIAIVEALREPVYPNEEIAGRIGELAGDVVARSEAFAGLASAAALDKLPYPVVGTIGRALYHAASTDNRIATSLRAAVLQVAEVSVMTANMLLAGMWSELYLDEAFRPRTEPSGGPFEILFALDEDERLRPSGAAIVSLLGDAASGLLARPGTGRVELETTVSTRLIFDQPPKVLDQITVGGTPLLCDVLPGSRSSLAGILQGGRASFEEIVTVLAQRLFLPRSRLVSDMDPQTELAWQPELGARIIKLDEGAIVDPPLEDPSME